MLTNPRTLAFQQNVLICKGIYYKSKNGLFSFKWRQLGTTGLVYNLELYWLNIYTCDFDIDSSFEPSSNKL